MSKSFGPYLGELVELEATATNGNRNLSVRFLLLPDAVLHTDRLDPVAATQRKHVLSRLADLLRDNPDEQAILAEASGQLDRLASEIMDAADDPPTEPVDTPTIGKPMAPCADPVEGGVVAEELADVFRRYLILPHKSDADALALWALHAHAHDAFDYSPILILTSPERSSGKSRVLEVLEYLTPRAWRNLSPSNAALYRTIQKVKPTLLLDEADNIDFKDRGDLVTLLNGGYQKSGSWIPRCVGEGANLDVENFSVWCPKAFASIKLDRLPDTIVSRAVVVRLRRKLPTESIHPLRGKDADRDLLPIAGRAARWCADNVEHLAELYPTAPSELGDRAVDAWSSLLAIADAIGGDWPERARKAAVKIATGSTAPESIGELLLAHIRQVFTDKGADVVSSADLVRALNEIEGAPWAEWKGRGLTANALARQIHPHGVAPRTVRIGDGTSKGYRRDQFEDAWKRYLPPEHASNRHTVTNDGAQRLTPSPNRNTGSIDVTVEKRSKSFDTNECYGVTVQKPSGGEAELLEAQEAGEEREQASWLPVLTDEEAMRLLRGATA